jgi:hypothetical protein
MTNKTTYAMVALVAVTVVSFGITPAFAYSMRDAVEFDDNTLGASGFTSSEGSDCGNKVTVTPKDGNTKIEFKWNGRNSCDGSVGHSGDQSHPFNKVRGTISVDGTSFSIPTESGINDYFGQKTFTVTTTSSSEIDVDFKWYYRNS